MDKTTYTRADLERVHPSEVVEGDLLASADNAGGFLGTRVTDRVREIRPDTWAIEAGITYGQPGFIPVWIVRRDRRR